MTGTISEAQVQGQLYTFSSHVNEVGSGITGNRQVWQTKNILYCTVWGYLEEKGVMREGQKLQGSRWTVLEVTSEILLHRL